MSIQKVIEDLLEERIISEFSRNWIENSKTNEDNIRTLYGFLKKIGLDDDKIASQAHLLGMNPETIERNYQLFIGLLRQDYQDRESGREIIQCQAQLLGNSHLTINANVQYLHSLGIDYNNGFLLGTTPQLKRKKMAFLLREVFDYKNTEDKKETINKLYEFIRNNPGYLVKSIKSLEKSKKKIKLKVQNLK